MYLYITLAHKEYQGFDDRFYICTEFTSGWKLLQDCDGIPKMCIHAAASSSMNNKHN